MKKIVLDFLLVLSLALVFHGCQTLEDSTPETLNCQKGYREFLMGRTQGDEVLVNAPTEDGGFLVLIVNSPAHTVKLLLIMRSPVSEAFFAKLGGQNSLECSMPNGSKAKLGKILKEGVDVEALKASIFGKQREPI